MSLQIPVFPNKYDIQPLENAYGWISDWNIHFDTDTGDITLPVYCNVSSYLDGRPPIDTMNVSMGGVVGYDSEGGTISFPTPQQLIDEDPEFAQAFSIIRQKIYNKLKLHPLLNDSIDVE